MTDNTLAIRPVSYTEFMSMEQEWTQLLRSTRSDPLFLSWAWQKSWWEVFHNNTTDELLLICAYTQEGTLRAIAPLYKSVIKPSFGQKFTSLQFLGTRFEGSSGYRSECLEFILHPDEPSAARELVHFIQTHLNFDLLYLADMVSTSATATVLRDLFRNRYEEDSGYTYSVQTDDGNFQQYLATLGKNSRLRSYNRRKLLFSLENVQVIPNSKKTLDRQFSALAEFHRKRWNRTSDMNKHKLFVETLTHDSAIKVSGVTITKDTRVIATTLDLSTANRSYNIQIGFEESFSKKLSLGLLTLMYCIEACFNERKGCYDLLIGTGKRSNYKEHFSKKDKALVSLTIPRSNLLRVVYRVRAIAEYFLR